MRRRRRHDRHATGESPRMDIEATLPPAAVDARAARRIYRHRLPVRLMHWINVVCLTVLLMSGLNIFNAHPALYWGRESTFAEPWISFGARATGTSSSPGSSSS